ncbi:MAG: EF-hand domain-containing protein [Paracoccaceae bacterium]|nr:EF-hand domain-containing protein [Paracoccaceae bacterium]
MKTLSLALATTALAATAASAMSIGTFDQNGDRFVSYAEVTAVNPLVGRQEFRDLDVNRDNRLSSVELNAPGAEAILDRGMNASGTVRSVSDISGGSFVSEAQLTAAYPGLKSHEFDIIDTNNDGRVNSTEIYAADAQDILNQHEGGNGILVSLDAVDTDGSGFASLAELQRVYPGTTANDLRVFDQNRDGRISFNEFYAPIAVETLGKNK